jgi:hypothetical protein
MTISSRAGRPPAGDNFILGGSATGRYGTRNDNFILGGSATGRCETREDKIRVGAAAMGQVMAGN